MATYGPNTSTSFTSDSGPLGGTIAWDSDGTLLEATFAHGMQSTEALIYTDFGFDIPTDHTIVGVLLTFETKIKVSGSSECYDDTVKLRVSGSLTGTNKAGGYFYSVSSYGGSSDLWGATLTPALINSSAFGFAITSSLESGSTTRIQCENPSITIYTDGEDPPDGPGGGGAGAGNHVFLTFRNLAIPKGAQINKAFVTLTGAGDNAGIWEGNNADVVNAIICGHDVDSSDPPETYEEAGDLPRTISQVQWDEVEHWSTPGDTHETPNIACVIQEIVNRSGWESGNDLTLFIEYNGGTEDSLAITRMSVSHDDEPTDAAKLSVYWVWAPETEGGVVIGGEAYVHHYNPNRYPTGGVVIGGAATYYVAYVGTGGVVVGGSAITSRTWERTGTGGVVIGGSAIAYKGSERIPEGGVVIGGTADYRHYDPNRYPEGGVVIGGTALVTKSIIRAPSGGVVVGSTPYLFRKLLTVPAGAVLEDIDKFYLPIATRIPGGSENVLFTTIQGSDLAHEVRDYDSDTDRIWAYVKIPLQAASSNQFYLYWGEN